MPENAPNVCAALFDAPGCARAYVELINLSMD